MDNKPVILKTCPKLNKDCPYAEVHHCVVSIGKFSVVTCHYEDDEDRVEYCGCIPLLLLRDTLKFNFEIMLPDGRTWEVTE